MAFTNPRGAAMAVRQAGLRLRSGPGAFGYSGKQYNCTSKSYSLDAGGDLEMQGAVNAADIDERLVSLSPSDFMQDGLFAPPLEGADCEYQGRVYRIKKVLACEVAFGTFLSLLVVIYRSPASDSATTETPAEAVFSGRPQDAGKRKQYSPPPSTL